MADYIKRKVSYYTKKYMTNDPYELADCLNITVLRLPLGDMSGYYKLLKRRRYIFLNSDIDDEQFCRVVMAHELGHAILHRKENCAFMEKNTLLLTSRIEQEANMFAAALLISDGLLEEYTGYTKEQFCSCTGYPTELLDLKLNMKKPPSVGSTERF